MKRILKNKIFLVVVTFLLTFSFAFSGMMVYNSLNPSNNMVFEDGVLNYMRIDGISYQSNHAGAPSESIQVNTIIFAGLNSGISVSGLRGERTQISDVVVEKFVDDTFTPQLWDFLFRNTRISQVFFYIYAPTGEGTVSQAVLVTLDTVYISSIVNSYTTVSSEQITFRFSRITMEFQNSGQMVEYDNTGR